MTAQQPMGFGGLISLASSLPAMPKFDPPALPSAPSAPTSTVSDQARSAAPRPFWTKGRAWAAIGVIGLAFWGINAANEGSRSKPSYAPPEQRVAQSPTYGAPSTPQYSAAATEVETKPAIGANLAHSRAELRYCFAEKVRVGLMLDMIDNRISAHVRNVNALVDDYNARCGSYRYRESDRTAAQASVDRDTANLTSQARARISSWR